MGLPGPLHRDTQSPTLDIEGAEAPASDNQSTRVKGTSWPPRREAPRAEARSLPGPKPSKPKEEASTKGRPKEEKVAEANNPDRGAGKPPQVNPQTTSRDSKKRPRAADWFTVEDPPPSPVGVTDDFDWDYGGAREQWGEPEPLGLELDEDEEYSGPKTAGTKRPGSKDSRSQVHGVDEDFDPGSTFDWYDKKEKVAATRNRERIRAANAADERHIGKHLPDDISAFFPFAIEGPNDTLRPPKDWVDELAAISHEQVRTPKAPTNIQFRANDSSVEANGRALERCGWDLAQLLRMEKGTTVEAGSEFRPWDQVARIIGPHPYGPFLKGMLTKGMGYEVTRKLSEDEREAELKAQLARGNHKSALGDTTRLKELLFKDVNHGFCVPVPVSVLEKLKGAMVQPCGVVSQFSLQADGTRKLKKRLTHDLSFAVTQEGISVNDRVDMTKYPGMFYGWCLSRVVHFAVCLRHKHPTTAIYAQKFDYSDAYRRLSHTAEAAAATILAVDGIGFIMLRLAFGGSPNPAAFCGFSEVLTDLANELACAKLKLEHFHIPTVQQEHLEVVPYPGDAETPFGVGIEPALSVNVEVSSKKDSFIDDIINLFLGTPENLARESFLVPLAVQLLSRPHAGDEAEPIPRKQLLGPDKLAAEGRPCEVQIILGWKVDLRKLEVALPFDKYKAWSQDLEDVLREGRAPFAALDSLVGRLNHSGYVIPLARHFLNRIRYKVLVRKPKSLVLRLSMDEIEDLKLWRVFLKRAHDGLSMNLLTVRSPTHIAWSDSCPYGLGGYSLSGFAWRLRIPRCAAFWGDDTVNNVLEFLGLAINILILLDESQGESFPCLMTLGDNTSSIGWVFRSGRMGRKSIYCKAVQFIARTVALKVMEANAQLCPQHLAGKKNRVADTLSFEGSPGFISNPTVEGRDLLVRLCNHANTRIYLDAKKESSFEDADRVQRRWHRFLAKVGVSDPWLDGIPDDGRLLLAKAFVVALRSSTFDREGNITGDRPKPMAAATIRNSAGLLGQAFRRHHRRSPFHGSEEVNGRLGLVEPVRNLLQAFEKLDPPPHRQAAATPELLKKNHEVSQKMGESSRHVADLSTGGFFFAMRACEFCVTPTRGRTKMLRLKDVTFRTARKRILRHSDPKLMERAKFVTINFVDQKNGLKNDRRTQGRSGRKRLCPVRAWVRVVQRVRRHDPNARPSTPVCQLSVQGETVRITSKQIADQLKLTCRLFGGKRRFGFSDQDLGTRSIRSGAAMALFMNDHSVEKIKILGRWSSDAFMVYIRPQVLEWTSIMAQDMAETKGFLDLTYGSGSSGAQNDDNWRELGVTIPSFSHRRR